MAHGQLLDAAHIIEDTADEGLPIVSNGLSLCKIHHAAFDTNLLGISPDYIVQINAEVLAEHDGPMLRHGLQEMNGHKLILPSAPKHWPDPDRLDRRFSTFLAAS